MGNTCSEDCGSQLHRGVREAVWIKGLTDTIFCPAYSTYTIRWPIEFRGDNQGSLMIPSSISARNILRYASVLLVIWLRRV